MNGDDNVGGLVPPREFDRRGVDAALLAVTKTLVNEVEKRAIAAEQAHEQFHAQEEKARTDRVNAMERLLAEVDKRLTQQRIDDQKAVATAFASSQKALEALQVSNQTAIDKSERAQAETNKATFVSLEKLGEVTSDLIPRAEADSKGADLARRLTALENWKSAKDAEKSERREISSSTMVVIGAVISFVVMAVLIATFIGNK